MNKCFLCNHDLVWQSDYDTGDYGIERQGIVSNHICSGCGAEYQVIQWLEDEI